MGIFTGLNWIKESNESLYPNMKFHDSTIRIKLIISLD